jgi:shikimate dehydrogenase
MRAKKFTIFGNPVKHSISPKMHTFAIEGLGLDASYTKTLVEDANNIPAIFLSEFDGANVTIPHKEAVYNLCDEVRGVAKEIKAINTLINEDGNMIGYNTDAEGFYRSMREFEGVEKILIIGAGGTTKALSYILKQKGFDLTILNRSKKRLESFKDFKRMSWDEFCQDRFDLIVNTTSAGLTDNSLPAPKELMQKIFKDAKYAIDVIYNKNTPFLKMAKEFNLKSKDGSDMLLYQGVLAFMLFYPNQFSFEEIEMHMRRAF